MTCTYKAYIYKNCIYKNCIYKNCIYKINEKSHAFAHFVNETVGAKYIRQIKADMVQSEAAKYHKGSVEGARAYRGRTARVKWCIK